ncbi:hypothetical protein EVG20_g5175 [Dentipellis fragilis]|uniref:F-box domain-containing protein n=1 Tax=Dentipellis fragilis TaxID=205917 RepID=A0A4Y9YVY8_9AGAM|nr:hypothetical protein EVG20_g5175 [Dentipellis fragilis]
MPHTLPTIPAELIQEIALLLPSTVDIINCRSICRSMTSALSTTALFKRRLVSSGWDLDAWEAEEREDSMLDERLQRWMQIDFMHIRVLEFLAEACSYEHFQPVASGIDPTAGLMEASTSRTRALIQWSNAASNRSSLS